MTTAEAAERLTRHGPNTITVTLPTSRLKLLVENFFHTMAILLWCAGTVAIVAQMPELGIAIFAVNLINGTFSLWQEAHAEKATEALSKLLPATVQVVRDGALTQISADQLVPGDIIIVSEGDKISADARLLEAEALKVDQSTLTGESHLVRKTAEGKSLTAAGKPSTGTDLPTIIYAGTSALSGHGKAVVYATGTSTRFGHIASLTQTIADQPSPLQKEMVRVTRIVTIIAVSLGVAIFLASVAITHTQLAQAFIFAMGMIVAFVPEGMLPTVTLSLAMAVQRMAARQALVKKLSSVESLGCTNVICTDKTGTLTQNQMTVTSAFASGIDYTFEGTGYSIAGDIKLDGRSVATNTDSLLLLLLAGSLCNNARIEERDKNLKVAGDPTEISILVAAMKAGLDTERDNATHQRVHEFPFDSNRKCMSTIHQCGQERILFLKGSPAVVLDRCEYEHFDNRDVPLDLARRQILLKQIDAYAGRGLRVIAAGRRVLAPDNELNDELLEQKLTFLGLFAMQDPPHKEVPDAVARCREAGIQVVMITGDYEVTAEAIARRVGIITSESARIVTGAELDKMTESELVESLQNEIVFARVNPEHKLRVVTAFQKCGKIVAVTGDGVNDAPALKKADIGVAMGVAGTDVAREAADMILLDDNFASIVMAVEEGRTVYDNIKKFAVYVFTSNMAEAVPFGVMLLSAGMIPLPLTVMQVLSIDLGTDMVPAIGLGADPAARGTMQRPPRDRGRPLLSLELLSLALLWYGLIEAVAGLSGYFFYNACHGWPHSPLAAYGSEVWQGATTMTLACIVAGQVGAVYCCRAGSESILARNPFENKLVNTGVAFEIMLLTALINVPMFQKVFNTIPLSLSELGFAFLWAPAVIILDETRKLLVRR